MLEYTRPAYPLPLAARFSLLASRVRMPAVKRVLLLLIDGLRADVAERELAAGHLPHLAALTAGGSRSRAATAFPSTTSVAYLPFLTGAERSRAA